MINLVEIICPKHGIFKQSLNNHINQKKGCPKCAKNYKLDFETFVNKANIIHNNFYEYHNNDFINVATLLDIECPKHGQFKQTPNNHLSGVGCPYCKESKGEKEIVKLLEKHNINYIRQKTFKKYQKRKIDA